MGLQLAVDTLIRWVARVSLNLKLQLINSGRNKFSIPKLQQCILCQKDLNHHFTQIHDCKSLKEAPIVVDPSMYAVIGRANIRQLVKEQPTNVIRIDLSRLRGANDAISMAGEVSHSVLDDQEGEQLIRSEDPSQGEIEKEIQNDGNRSFFQSSFSDAEEEDGSLSSDMIDDEDGSLDRPRGISQHLSTDAHSHKSSYSAGKKLRKDPLFNTNRFKFTQQEDNILRAEILGKPDFDKGKLFDPNENELRLNLKTLQETYYEQRRVFELVRRCWIGINIEGVVKNCSQFSLLRIAPNLHRGAISYSRWVLKSLCQILSQSYLAISITSTSAQIIYEQLLSQTKCQIFIGHLPGSIPRLESHFFSPKGVPERCCELLDQKQEGISTLRQTLERPMKLEKHLGLSNEESKLTLKTTASQHAVNACKPWTPDEELCLLEAVRRHGNKSWLEISNYLPSRTPFQCRYHFCKINPHKLTKSVWQEPLTDLRLLIGLRIFGGRRSWALISQHLFHRTISDLQCNERFTNVLDTQLSNARDWSQAEILAFPNIPLARRMKGNMIFPGLKVRRLNRELVNFST